MSIEEQFEITTKVFDSELEKEVILKIKFKDDIVDFWIDDQKIFSADWSENLCIIFSRLIELFREDN